MLKVCFIRLLKAVTREKKTSKKAEVRRQLTSDALVFFFVISSVEREKCKYLEYVYLVLQRTSTPL